MGRRKGHNREALPASAMVNATCSPCGGKRRYPTRSSARAVAKQIPGPHMTAYRCPHFDGWWHLGRLPRSVVHGREAKGAFQARVARRGGWAS